MTSQDKSDSLVYGTIILLELLLDIAGAVGTGRVGQRQTFCSLMHRAKIGSISTHCLQVHLGYRSSMFLVRSRLRISLQLYQVVPL